MISFTVNVSSYLHTYEAYRIPSDSEILKEGNPYIIEDDGDSTLILTDKAKKQMLKDRSDYQSALLAQQDIVHSKHSQEISKKQASDEVKALAVFRNMSKGDIVPACDEQKLMEYNFDLYQMAKMAQALARRADSEKHKSEWDQREESEREKKITALKEAGDKLLADYPQQYKNFVKAQSDAVTEINAGTTVDLTI